MTIDKASYNGSNFVIVDKDRFNYIYRNLDNFVLLALNIRVFQNLKNFESHRLFCISIRIEYPFEKHSKPNTIHRISLI